ncbi:Hypothetical predicted protein, partial [Pelobates cultripes]
QDWSHITAIKHPDGTTKSKPTEIATVFEEFYEQLYNHTPDGNSQHGQEEKHILNYLDGLSMTKLNGEVASSLAAEISEDEVDRAISSLKGNKTPGPDGFNGTYYKTFREELTRQL